MDELSLAEGLRAVEDEAAHLHGVGRVPRVCVELGRFTALRGAYDRVMREGPVLEIVILPGMAHCFDCAQCVKIDESVNSCPDCGRARLTPESGDALRIKHMEVA